MKSYNKILPGLVGVILTALLATACQKLYRPALKTIIEDPTPPPYSELKSFWAFENNTTDQGENKLTGTATSLTYVAGVTGQALKIGADGYLLLKAIGDTVVYPNEFTAIPADTLRNLGNFTIAFWMNGVGPVTGGAQGIFSISSSTQFWGNLDIFLENNDNGDQAFFKLHLFNANKTGGGEQWIADDAMKFNNVLNKWTHVVFVYNASNSSFSSYIDGALVNQRTLDGGNYGPVKFNDFNGMVLGTFQFQTNPTLSNHGPEGWAKSFNGALDQFRLYNRPLTASEVNTLFTSKN